ncbi:MAG: S-methyl-5'-thioadenosine phosphorylase [Chloroflexi bacterium]|nr:S-methyl-5'-thioadenosine phosphorylase [Chloroflexota bacterium]MCL5076380.1 S-methyl-5'-thioadenosine phosphorylase [Chloroflexota bacterium]
MESVSIAVIGGSGLYQMGELTDIEEAYLSTPFGEPSDAITIGTIMGKRIAFLPRHGRGHYISPTNLNARANIYALKLLGVEQIISVSAVGSMKEEIAPLDIVIPDQLFDRTKTRLNTFFDSSIVVHIGFAEPFCPVLSNTLYAAAVDNGATVHKGGTLLCIEGPQFSTKAESRIYRQWGIDIIGMTAIPEAKLAREAEICYATLAMVTDYDVWHETEAPVTIEMVVENLGRNAAMAQRIIKSVVPFLSRERKCPCASALENTIITQRDRIPAKLREDLKPLLGKYF